MTKLEKLQKKLADAQSLYKAVGHECEGCARAGAYIQLKNAQRRSLSISNTITKIKAAIAVEANAQ
jgi:hypothetical protein